MYKLLEMGNQLSSFPTYKTGEGALITQLSRNECDWESVSVLMWKGNSHSSAEQLQLVFAMCSLTETSILFTLAWDKSQKNICYLGKHKKPKKLINLEIHYFRIWAQEWNWLIKIYLEFLYEILNILWKILSIRLTGSNQRHVESNIFLGTK